MSFMSSQFPIDTLIDVYGMDIKIYSRVITTDANGNVTSERYSNTIETRGYVLEFGGLVETYNLYGYRTEGDWSICVKSTVPVNVNDKILLPDDTELEAREIISHYDFNNILYKEVIARKEGT